MSRYQHETEKFLYAWGYDRPLQEYFVSKFKILTPEEEQKMIDNDSDDDDCVFSIMSHTTTNPHPDYPDKMDWSNSEIVDIMMAINTEAGEEIIPRDHITAVSMDLPY